VDAIAAAVAPRKQLQSLVLMTQARVIECTISEEDGSAVQSSHRQSMLQVQAVPDDADAASQRAERQAQMLEEAHHLTSQVQLAAEELERTKRRVQQLSELKAFPPRVKYVPSARSQLYLRQMMSKITCSW